MIPHHTAVSIAYPKIVDLLLALKAQGHSTDALADAIVRACREAGIDRIR